MNRAVYWPPMRAGWISLFIVAVLGISLLLAFGFKPPLLFVHRETAQAKSAQDKGSGTPQEIEKNLAEHLDSTDKAVTHLEQSVVIMLAFTALTLAILFGSIAFGEYRISHAVEDLENRAKEVKERFPRLAEMEARASEVLDEVRTMVKEEEWQDDRYKKMDIAQRQRILSADSLIALEFLGPVKANQLRGMANFYSSKFTVEKLAADLDRALYYALLAAQRGNEEFQYKNDLGFIYMDLADRDPFYRAKAKSSFENSKHKRPEQQRCYYNLGRIFYDEAMAALKHGDVDESNRLLMQAQNEWATALPHKIWETKPSEKLTSLIHYNLACVLCRLAPGAIHAQGKSREMDTVVAHLKEASQFGQTKHDAVKNDFELAGGDLERLASNQHYTQEVAEIRTSFEEAWKRDEEGGHSAPTKKEPFGRIRAAYLAARKALKDSER
jgi:hypothetical protein